LDNVTRRNFKIRFTGATLGRKGRETPTGRLREERYGEKRNFPE
jgi:hypothetical protein